MRETSQQVGFFIVTIPPKIDIEPENDGLKDDLPLPGLYSQVPS